MIPIALWAPRAGLVLVEQSGRQAPLEQHADGWWRGDIDDGDDYWFVVDGTRIPDPRSTWQPHGLDGPSRPNRPDRFVWTDADWKGLDLEAAVIYELHVGTFSPSGTYAGVVERLDHLVDLGVTAIELMPLATFPGEHGWGYDGALLWAPHHRYGAPDDLRRLVDACHARGLGVLVDVVYNHLGPTGNHLDRLGPYFTDAVPTPWGAAVNFDGPDSDEVRAFVVGNARHWITAYHVDGLRLDAVHAIFDRSATHILEEIADVVHRAAAEQGRQALVIAESDLNDPRLVAGVEVGGYGLDGAWSDDFHHSLHTALTGERHEFLADFDGWADVARSLEKVFVHDGTHSSFRRRRHGRPVGELPRHRFLGYVQNHDQIGNRATGERLAHLVGRRGAEAAGALVLTAPFTPMLFQGEEWAASAPFLYFTDHTDPDVAAAVRDGRRAEFSFSATEVPDPQSADTFRRSQLDWDELSGPEHAAMLDWYRHLLALRRAWPALRSDGPADTRASLDTPSGVLQVRRGDDALLVVNTASTVVTSGVDGGLAEVVLTNDAKAAADGRGVMLGPRATALCRLSGPER